MLTLRAPEPSDLDFLFTLESAEACGEGSFASAPVSRQMLWEYINSYDADIYAARQLRLIAVDSASGERVGAVDIYDFDPRNRRGFVGIAIVEGKRGLGYGKQALEALCLYASSTLGIHQLAAVVAEDNAASRALFTACAFKGCGRLRSWLRRGTQYADAIIFQRLFC
ncbi:MAG: GNAT family N-acetyltransferase [Muribaculaceae bacterium]|nr:GNAT family N-acetyltransferase [Muribaculaceae bacterium]